MRKLLILMLFASSAFAQGPITPSPRNRFERIGVGADPAASTLVNVVTSWNNGAPLSNYPIKVDQSYVGTDHMPLDPVTYGIASLSTYGNLGAPAVGSMGSITGFMGIQGSGSSGNEYDVAVLAMRADIGTGYTQTTGPVGRLWMIDSGVHGPIAVQPNLMQGYSMFMNNYYNGSPTASPACAVCIMTKPGSGPAVDSLHGAATTYPVDIGLLVAGDSTGGNNGFTKAIQIGGPSGLTGWSTNTSHIGTGIDIANTYSNAIHVVGGNNVNHDIWVESAYGNIALGKKNTASTPLMDWFSSGVTSDYDVRLTAANGSGTHGSGQFTINAQATFFTYQDNSPTVYIAPSASSIYMDFGLYWPATSTADVRLVRSTTKTLQLDDTAGGAATLTVKGPVITPSLTITPLTTPGHTDACTAGTFYVDTGFIYVCTASGTVKRTALSTF